MFDFLNTVKSVIKRFTIKDVFLLIGVLLLYIGTRLINLVNFPIFTDEGIYIHWARIAWHDATWRFISLTDGKQPLQTWGTIPFLKLFPENSLLAGRLFSVSTGLAAVAGMFVLLYYLFNKRAAILGTFIFVLTPYFLFYDRLALADSGVNAAFIWIFFFSVFLVKSQRLDVSLLFGIAAGLGLLMKSSVQLFLGLSLFAPILIFQSKFSSFIKKSVNYLILFGLSAAIALVLYNVQRLSPFFHYIALKNTTFIRTFAEVKADPFGLILHNLYTLPYYVASEMAYISALFALIGLIMLWRKDKKLAAYITLWIVIPFLVLSLISKVVFPRYLIFFASMLTVLTTYFLIEIKKTIFPFALGILLISFAVFNYTILFDPVRIPFPPIDRGQYVVGVTAGWHIPEMMQMMREKSAEKPVVIVAEGNFGLIADMLDVFLKPSDRMSIKGYWPLNEESLKENQELVGENYVYVVFSHRTEFPREWPIKLIEKYEKPGGESAFYLYELKGQENGDSKSQE